MRALVLAILFSLVTSVAAAGKQGPGTKAVKSATDTITSLLAKEVEAGSQEEKDLAAKVTESVRGFLDVDQLGERALSDHWSTLSETQKTQFLELLRALIEDNYVKGLRANLE